MAQGTGAAGRRHQPHLQDIYQADASLVECSKRWDDLEEELECQGTENPDYTAEETQVTQRAGLGSKGRRLSAISKGTPYVRMLILASPRSMLGSAACR